MASRKIFYVVHARVKNRKSVLFDPLMFARNYDERRKLQKPYWAVAFVGYIFDYGEDGKCVALVQRTKTARDQAKKWALIPAGTSDCLEEIKHPQKLIERERDEELIICEDEKRVELVDARLLTASEIEIVDTSTNEKYFSKGELYHVCASEKIFLAQAYYVEKNIDSAVFFDGELDPCGRQLDRKIALVDIRIMKGIVEPIAVFQSKQKLPKQKIDLDNSAPSLDWFREFIKDKDVRPKQKSFTVRSKES